MAKFRLRVDGRARELNGSRALLTVLSGEDYMVQTSARGGTTTQELPGGGTKTITRTPDGVTTTTWHDPAAGNGSPRTTTSVVMARGTARPSTRMATRRPPRRKK